MKRICQDASVSLMTPRRRLRRDAVKQTASPTPAAAVVIVVVAEETAQTASPTPAAAASDVNVIVIVVVAEETASEFQLDRR